MSVTGKFTASSPFRFGENWSQYSRLVDAERVVHALESVQDLVGSLKGKSFLDIGSGSGLFSVAALRLGASEVMAIDVDPESVATTRRLLDSEQSSDWHAEQMSVFDLPDRVHARFDVVYSWGVLHHTGAMWRALDRASEMVATGGLLVVALYERTPMCRAWTLEKRAYSRMPWQLQKSVRALYLTALGVAMMAKRHNPLRKLRATRERGMDPVHDAHDWLGGYPYESTCAAEVWAFMKERGFEQVVTKPWRVRLFGLLGTGCSEYVFRRITDRTKPKKQRLST